MNNNPYDNNQDAGFSPFEAVPTSPASNAHKGFAIASMVLGIVSVVGVCCCCCCGLFFIPLVCGILAVVFSFVTDDEIAFIISDNAGIEDAHYICKFCKERLFIGQKTDDHWKPSTTRRIRVDAPCPA